MPSLASGLTNDSESAAAIDYFMRHPFQQSHQQHTPGSTQSSGSARDEAMGDKRGRSTSPIASMDGSYPCTQCSASFQSRDQLDKHEMSHSPVPPVVSTH